MSEIIIYQTSDNQTTVEVQFEEDTCWLSLNQIAELFERDKSVISRHLKNIYKKGELEESATVAKNATVQMEAHRTVKRELEYYNLDAILSVGYRVNSKRGTQFRQWATQRLKDYLLQGYAINEKRLALKNQQVEYLKTGIRILSRAITKQTIAEDDQLLRLFASGLELLDDYDNEQLDKIGKTVRQVVYPSVFDYIGIISQMKSSFESDVFAKPKEKVLKVQSGK